MEYEILPDASGESAAATLSRLTSWAQAFEARLASQSGWLQVLEEHLMVAVRTHLPGAEVVPSFIDAVIDGVLTRQITGVFAGADHAEDRPYRWEDLMTQEIPSQRRQGVVQVAEDLHNGLVHFYTDYLQRHWQGVADEVIDPARYERALQHRLAAHIKDCQELLAPEPTGASDAASLRLAMMELQDDWGGQSTLRALASDQELARVDLLIEKQQPSWLKNLRREDREGLRDSQARVIAAVSGQQQLLTEVATLADYATHRARAYFELHHDLATEPALIKVHRQFNAQLEHHADSVSLTELLSEGPVAPDQLYTITGVEGPVHAHRLPSPQAIGTLLMEVDAPSDYFQALSDCYAQQDVGNAMAEALHEQLRHSRLLARAAGHLSAISAQRLAAGSGAESQALDVCDVQPLAGFPSGDLLLFFSRGQDVALDTLLLYAPGKPDGQEWVEITSLRGLSAELGGWLKDEAGREYVLQQLPHALRTQAAAHIARMVELPSQWGLGRDCRGETRGYSACLAALVARRQANHLSTVERSHSARWRAALSIRERRTLHVKECQARWYAMRFQKKMAGYPTFMDFAKTRVAADIRPYLRSKGVSEDVDPRTILIDYDPLPDGSGSRTVSLLDIVVQGYDDNSGIDHAQRRVRSSTGQDLTGVSSADLAYYARGAWIGDKYKESIRQQYLNRTSPEYPVRRDLFSRMQVARIDLDLRVALGRGHLAADVHDALVSLLREPDGLNKRGVRAGPQDVASSSGMFGFTLSDKIVSGVYVFRLIRGGRGQDWLYTPDSPDERLFRPQPDLHGTAAEALRDYLVGRVALVDQTHVASVLVAVASSTRHLDSIRESRRVIRLADEFDAGVERALTDVQDLCVGRARMIQAQVLKGVLFAALPLALVCPPFALLMDVGFLVYGLQRGVIAQTRGDTAQALQAWLEASWSLLGIHLGVSAALGLRFVGPLTFRRVKGAARRGDDMSLARPDKHWALARRPQGLSPVIDSGVWRGTYTGTASGEHYVLSGGRYYRVTRHGGEDCLRVINARRPDSYFKLPVRLDAEGRLRHVRPGLPGGGEVRDLQRVGDLRQAFPGHVAPDPARGALQGEAVVGAFSAAQADNYLFTLNVQTCVAVSLYNRVNKTGAILHFDHNIKTVIDRAVSAVLPQVRGTTSARDIQAMMVGGDWLTGADIGGPVRNILRRNGLRPSWDHWSYSSCLGNTFGVSLDLRTGVTRVFTTSSEQIAAVYDPLLKAASFNAPGMPGRTHRVLRRVRAEPLVQRADGVVDSIGRPASPQALAEQAISIIAVS